ncbi:MAG: hypothetical protein U1E56_13600 [Bauldia sp.]
MQEYWVVGGTYEDPSFAALRPGAAELLGPFLTYDDALAHWRERTANTRSRALNRYSIVVSADREEAAAA